MDEKLTAVLDTHAKTDPNQVPFERAFRKVFGFKPTVDGYDGVAIRAHDELWSLDAIGNLLLLKNSIPVVIRNITDFVAVTRPKINKEQS